MILNNKRIVVFLLLLITSLVGVIFYIFNCYNTQLSNFQLSIEQKIDNNHSNKENLNYKNLYNLNIAILKGIMANKVEDITKDESSIEGKVLALAHWISANIANNQEFGPNVYTWFAARTGLCGGRSAIFIEMLKYINVYSIMYNICKFPDCNSSHSCVQVYYENAWHFFDVTYAGYFQKNNKILSFEELIEISRIEDPLKYLIVLNKTLDINKNFIHNIHELPAEKAIKLTKVDNTERMHRIYSKNNIINASEYGSSLDKLQCLCCKNGNK